VFIEMQLGTTNLQLPQHTLDAPSGRRIVSAVASDEFLNNGSKRRWSEFLVPPW
jgi:hypothetical protein